MTVYLDPELADEMGLVGVGGDLSPRRLVEAYCRGVFPWYDADNPICWWSPDPRAIFELDDVPPHPQPLSPGGRGETFLRVPPHLQPLSPGGRGETGLYVSRRLARTLRSGKFRCTVNQAFGRVMRVCADREEGTWITAEMIGAYERLHRLGFAHSVEAWRGDELAGGIYGVAIRGFFAGESMFTRIRDGSKVALAFLVDHLRKRGYRLFDIQFLTPHTTRLGAIEIPRAEYLRRLRLALEFQATF